MNINFKEKLDKLKAMYSGEDAHPDAVAQISEYEKRVQELSRAEEFFNFQATQELYAFIKYRVKQHMLARVTATTTEDMTLRRAQEEECRIILNLFNPNYAEELETLENIIDNELLTN